MCGIAGIVSQDTARFAVLPAMVASLAHRGPDDDGIEHLPGAALGHRRLSIIDLEHGHQPMLDETGTVGIVFNGEIYNYRALQRQLESEGRTFRTGSDTEVLLQVYLQYGTDCVKHLNGMFAFAIWDARKQTLFAARDHMGQKPFFYHMAHGGIVFGSEIKAILASGLVRPTPDLKALYDYISLRFIPGDLTLFESIRKLPAAHYLVWHEGQLKVERYWQLDFNQKIKGSERELTQALEDQLTRTVEEHTVSDVPVGAFLSGGIDSSLITALLAQQTADPVATFSIGVEEQDFNELPFAREVATQYHTDHHDQVVKADLVRLLPKMIWHLEEPADPFGVGVYLVSALASRSVKVVLSGDGGDELFAGYDRFVGHRLADVLSVIPKAMRRGVVRRLIDLVPDTYTYKSMAQKLRWINEMSLLTSGDRYAHSMSFLRYSEEAKAELLTDDAKRRLGTSDSRLKILEHFDSQHATHVVDRMLYTDLMTRMPDHLLSIVDRMAMAHSLEVRPPLLEHGMVEFAASLPANLKLKGTKLKYILRAVASRHLSSRLINRKKQGFGFPLAYWMRNDLQPLLQDTLRTSRFVESGIFNHEFLRNMITEHVEGKQDHNFRLWIFLNLEIWYRLFVEGLSQEQIGEWVDEFVPPQTAV